jgi:cysteine desulfurase
MDLVILDDLGYLPFIALGAAAALASASLPDPTPKLLALRDRLHAQLEAGVPDLQLNGHPQHRLPNTLHVAFPGVGGRALLADVPDTVAASVGSACHTEHDHHRARLPLQPIFA